MVNGLSAYKLKTANTASSTFMVKTGIILQTAIWSIEVKVRFANETETSVTTSNGVTRSVIGVGYQSESVSISNTTMTVGVAVKVIVRVQIPFITGGNETIATFITEKFNADSLDSANWNVTYYTQIYFGLGLYSYRFYFGDSSYESKIENFVYSPYSIPSIGEFQAPSTVYADEYVFLNCTVMDPQGNTTIVNATIEISNNIILKYDNATDTFSEYQDTNNHCTLDAANSVRSEVDSTSFKLSWKIKLNWTYPEGLVSVIASNTKVYDEDGHSESGSHTDLFTFTKGELTITFSSDRESPMQGQTITLNWTIKRWDDSTVTDFNINISKDAVLWKTNLAANGTTDTEANAVSHTYDCSSVKDNTYNITSFSSTPLTISWTGEGRPSPGPGPGPGPTPSPVVPHVPIQPTPPFNLVFVGVVAIAAIVVLASVSGELEGKLAKSRRNWSKTRKSKKKKKWEKKKKVWQW